MPVSHEKELEITKHLTKHPGATRREICEATGISTAQIDRAISWKERRHLSPAAGRPKSQVRNIDPWAWLDWCSEGSALHADLSTNKNVLHWKSPRGARPVAICFLGDAHSFSIHTDHTQLKEDLQLIRDEPDLFLLALGDQCQHMMASFPSAKPVAEQMAGPAIQVQVWWAILREMRKKVVAASLGNHEAFAEKVAGLNIFGQGAAKIVPIFAGKGLTFLRVGKQKYSVLTLHKGKGRSKYNKAAQAIRAYEDDYPADVTAAGHTHHFGMSWDDHYALAREAGARFGGERISLNCGTYQTGKNEYSMRLGGSGGIYATPTVIFFPSIHKVVPFRDVKDAVVYMRGLRGVDGDER